MSIDRRRVLAGLAAGLMVPGRAFAGGADESDPPLIPEDYAVARRTFRTHLLRRGPAPDDPQPLTPPPGARAVPYRSGPLDLVAWLSTDPTRSAIHPRPAVSSSMAATRCGRATSTISRGPMWRRAISR